MKMTFTKKQLKREKLKLIDSIINGLNGKMGCGNPKTPISERGCGNYSKDYAKGFNDCLKIIKYNLGIERKLIYHNCKSCYELAVKLSHEIEPREG